MLTKSENKWMGIGMTAGAAIALIAVRLEPAIGGSHTLLSLAVVAILFCLIARQPSEG